MNKGYTLLEILLVLVILGVLSGLMVTSFKVPKVKYLQITVEPQHLVHFDGYYYYLWGDDSYVLMNKDNTFYHGALDENYEAPNTGWVFMEIKTIPMEPRWNHLIEQGR